ncbi:hypothetical protein BamIOP4010DRAFT_3075 [Burkholderia ambifaria IOP40-10]|uniref:Uncharacterized protein n=1 Tax=Burkholderia ambifaria IOP40-10 TaxID=396596 RepID=B1FGB5_9BURK|nr:hypothetical protein BamIOP4010DRAFT_3075 [Burkholderia ambifaria IOP40-10]
MGVIGGGRREHDFRVGREFDHAGAGARIGHRHSPHLRIVLGGYHHLDRRCQGAVATHELGAILGESHFVAVRYHAGGLPRRRPDVAAVGVAQIQIAAPIVARRVLPPTRDGQIVAAAVAGACGREHHRVAAVGQQMRDGRGIVRRQQTPRDAGIDAMHPAGGARVDPRPPCRDPARYSLLQQQLGGADGRLAVEEGANAPAQQRIGDRHDRHALVMRHERPHDGNRHAFRHARGRVVERFVEAEASARAGRAQPLEVARGGVRRDHRRERGRIGRDHQVLVEIALEPQLRHAEARILIGQLDVARVVRRFRHAPRQAQPVAIGDLATHHQVIGAREQAAVRRAHHQRRHQVFEHRSRPRDQRRAVPDRRRQAAEPEPVPRRDIALRDRDETRQARLRRQQVVVARIEPSVGHRVADRQQIPHRVEQKAELHRIGHLQRGIGQRMKTLVQHVRFVRRARRVATMPLHRVLQRLRPKQHVVDVAAPHPADVVHQRSRYIGDRRGEDRDRGPFRCGALPGRRGERLLQLGRGPLELAVQGRPGIAIPAHGLAQQRERIADPFVRGLPPHAGGLIRPRAATVAERDQVPGEIAAVDRRHIPRLEGPQVPRVVPIIEMTAIALHQPHRREGLLQPRHRVQRAKPAELAGADGRQQVQPDIGGRSPVRDNGLRVLLEIVQRQHLIVSRHEGLEITPGPARVAPQLACIVRGHRQFARRPRCAAQPVGDRRRSEPDQRERNGQPARMMIEAPARHQADSRAKQRERHAAAHLQIGERQGPPVARAGFGRRDPFEQMATADPHAKQRARDRVAHRPRLLRQHDDRQAEPRQREPQLRRPRIEHAARGHLDARAPPARHQSAQYGQQKRQRDRHQHEGAPGERHGERQHPSGQQRDQHRGGRERAAQVVQHLPAADRRQRFVAENQPRQELPVAARPSVQASRRDVVAGRRRFDHLDIRRQPGPRENAFEQIVTEHRVLRHAAGEHRLERVDVVDALARIGAFVEQILIDVRYGRHVRIDAVRARRHALEQRALVAAREGRSHARLKHAVALDDAPARRVEYRPVERVRHLADQAAHGIAQQPRIGIERDHVAHVRRHARRLAFQRDERRVRCPAQQPVQLVQLAALALPAHPAPFAVVPHALAVQQQKALAFVRRRRIESIQPVDARHRGCQQPVVAVGVRGGRIHPVGKQCEVKRPVGARQMMNFQLLDLLGERRFRRQQHRHRDQGAQPRRDAVEQREARQDAGADIPHYRAIDERDRGIQRGQQAGETEPDHPVTGRFDAREPRQHARQQQRDNQPDTAEITAETGVACQAP